MFNPPQCVFVFLVLLLVSFSVNADDSEQSNVMGSVIGAAAGSLLGYQFGGGRGKYATTAIGAVGGYLIGGNIQERIRDEESSYESDYQYTNNQLIYIGEDDYLIKQRLSNERKRRNMIRNGEVDPLEMPYDQSEVQTSWDDPYN